MHIRFGHPNYVVISRRAAARGYVGGKYLKICAHCGEPFRARRADAKYCAPRCRTAAHRGAASDATAETVTSVTLSDIRDIRGMLYRGKINDALEALDALMDKVE